MLNISFNPQNITIFLSLEKQLTFRRMEEYRNLLNDSEAKNIISLRRCVSKSNYLYLVMSYLLAYSNLFAGNNMWCCFLCSSSDYYYISQFSKFY